MRSAIVLILLLLSAGCQKSTNDLDSTLAKTSKNELDSSETKKATNELDPSGTRAAELRRIANAARESCAAAMGIDTAFTNSIGMQFNLIPPGKFKMGSPESELGFFDKHHEDEFLHEVEISKPFFMCVHEVTVGQFKQFVGETGYKTEAEADGFGGWGYDATNKCSERKPDFNWQNTGFEQTDDHPVVMVRWNDALRFCQWLSEKENKTYRLPTEAEWEYACRAGTESRYYHGDDPEGLVAVENTSDAGSKQAFPDSGHNLLGDDGFVFTAPVGSFKANAFGLFDMLGNAREYCQDKYDYDYYKFSPSLDPVNLQSGTSRVSRGGSWVSWAVFCRSAVRTYSDPSYCYYNTGFRVVCEPETNDLDSFEPQAFANDLDSSETRAAELRRIAEASRQSYAAAKGIDTEITNSIGMKFTLIPPGKFKMGSPESEVGTRDKHQKDEFQHEVEISKAFYSGATEVAQSQWQAVMGTTPWKENGADKTYAKSNGEHAASYISWDDAVEFCQKLSAKEGKTYRLPTEAEWEYACRAGSKTEYSFGDDASKLGDYAWFDVNAWDKDEKYAHAVRRKKPNAFGLYDIHGNVYEWCQDKHDKDYYENSPPVDPVNLQAGCSRVLRGGSWDISAVNCRSARRIGDDPSRRDSSSGFRVVCELE